MTPQKGINSMQVETTGTPGYRQVIDQSPAHAGGTLSLPKRTRLLLTRRTNEAILIGNNVRVAVDCVDRGKVRLVIEAPENLFVDREELRERIRGQTSQDRAQRRAQGLPTRLPGNEGQVE